MRRTAHGAQSIRGARDPRRGGRGAIAAV